MKVRGYRIELGDVRAALAALDGVEQAVVITREDPTGALRLIGYVTGHVDVVAARSRLAEHLPPYMVPAAVVRLDAMPLTVNGKIDRNALPKNEFHRVDAYRPPADVVEEVLAGIYAEVLGLDRVGVDESFFALGGDSILSMQVVSRARAAGLGCRPHDIFLEQTVAALALVVDVLDPGVCGPGSADDGRTSSDIAPTWLTPGQLRELRQRYSAADVLPLTPKQQGLLFHASTAKGVDEVYAVQLDISITGSLDPQRLQEAVQSVVIRHPNVVARFCEKFDEPVQLIPAHPESPWRYLELGGADLEEQIEALCVAERHAVCDLEHQAPFRAMVIRTARDRYRFILTNHHIVLDGWSMPIVLDEIFAGYRRRPLPAPAPYRRAQAGGGQGRVRRPDPDGTVRSARARRTTDDPGSAVRSHHRGADGPGPQLPHHAQHRAARRVGAGADGSHRPA